MGTFFQKGDVGLGIGFCSGDRGEESRRAATDNDDLFSTDWMEGIFR
jgi:hypothetical protein